VPSIDVDHEHILDSDSILSCPIYRARCGAGSGVIACEYASIFAALGCAVTLLDKAAEPLGFLDPALRTGFLTAFQAMAASTGGRGCRRALRWVSQVEVQLRGGEVLSADIVFAAFGRVANLEGIGLDRCSSPSAAAGTCRWMKNTRPYSRNFAAGDAIGPPALACAAADQGARGARGLGAAPPGTPVWCRAACIHPGNRLRRPVPERRGFEKIDVIVGRADFSEVARAHIAARPPGSRAPLRSQHGAGSRVSAIGEGATDLVHLGSGDRHGATADSSSSNLQLPP